ncbi:hypothetical protein PIB30_048428 [Stylosanthes scabra]|uniref:Uncharacterized protein n=1 Tax=Stylosanthes scabra TaxID=79078 RepID=A0ABU6THE5_9FABA|nr:hypothetical protein [Stylosanthes scabra]
MASSSSSFNVPKIKCEYCQLLGFLFCCVVSQNLPPRCFHEWGSVRIKCEYCHLGDGIKHKYVSERAVIISERRLNSDHVLIWTNRHFSYMLLSKIERCRDCDGSDDHGCTCNQKMSFRFSVDRPEKGKRVEEMEEDDEDCYIKGCGVIPVYASTVVDAIQKLELEFNLNPHHNSIPSCGSRHIEKSHDPEEQRKINTLLVNAPFLQSGKIRTIRVAAV